MQTLLDIFFKYGHYVFTPLHILVCFVLIAIVLLQTGKGADWAGALGGGGTQTAFGPRGVENTLSKLTKYAAVLFMVTSLGLSIVKSKRATSSFGDLPSRSDVEAQAPGEAAPDETEAATDAAETPVDGASGDAPATPGEDEPAPTGTETEKGGEQTPGE